VRPARESEERDKEPVDVGWDGIPASQVFGADLAHVGAGEYARAQAIGEMQSQSAGDAFDAIWDPGVNPRCVK
jgi:hypothetical protein